MITSLSSTELPPTHCNTPQQRAEREAATQVLLNQRAAATDPAERQRLLEDVVELNIEIARGIARRYRNRGAEADDLEQVACLALVKAASGYQLDSGTPFIAYAVPTIRGEIKRYFRDSTWTVRIPRRLQELQGAITTKVPVLEQQLNRQPTTEEIAEYLGATVEEIDEARAAKGCFNVLSLDRPSATDDGLTLADALPAPPDREVEHLETLDQLAPLLERLDDRSRRILHLRFVETKSQSQIGEAIGCSQMQVSRLLKATLERLRAQLDINTVAA
ncbi:SigB/SigF/SigG family RNA polymerase sigma factor [Kribbella sp. CA-293567]|uniref:SigB/SigF/SigG family RNA polymerase sigma factor n=1 Tax=Kribbella sp. CA-293567 TaxID=3002436 RepID=UPI0022DE8575|nr:SigB/SigF/SigG family RNA polymerase sigma factor [Kribbella sp. CA-293567]WBQ03505.1 SigB/SigF/SigG family RNA polymerase sigma factor [Kribbella sp. CA-293567]